MDNLSERDRDIFEAGYAACWSEMFVKSAELPAFTLTDAVFDRAWDIYLETHPGYAAHIEAQAVELEKMREALEKIANNDYLELMASRDIARASLTTQAVEPVYPSLELCVKFSDDGQHIRKWSRIPFDGGTDFYSHPPQPDALAKGVAAVIEGAAKRCYEAGTAQSHTTPGTEADRLREALRWQMEHQSDDVTPSSIQRDKGLVWLEGWFDIEAALTPKDAE